MAKERGQADVEAGKSLRHLGFFARKHTDAMICPNCHKMIYPSGNPGTFDFPGVYVPPMRGNPKPRTMDIEVKAGNTSLAFSSLRDDQRAWAESTPENEKYLWICVGTSIRDKKYPRKTWLMPLDVFYHIEKTLDRKSIPYNCTGLAGFELEWLGGGLWDIPAGHSFWRGRWQRP